MEQAASKANPLFFMLDAAYDQLKVYEAARNVKAQAIIPLNLRREQEPPAVILASGRRYAQVSLSARNRQSRLFPRHGNLLVLVLWHGRESERQGRPPAVLQSTPGHQTLERTLR